MKKVLSLVLALVLVLGMIPTFADEHESGAQLLFEHEFVVGDGTGDLMVDKALTRAEMAVLLAQMNGLEDEAAVFAAPSNFTDANTFGWASNFISFAQANAWVSGLPDGSYNPMGEVTGQQLLSFLLQTLGYEVTWETVVADAAALGLEVSTEGPILRGAAFETMWTAVSEIHIFGTEITIGEATGKIEPEVVVPEVLELVEVSANNLFQVFVEFNMDVEEYDEVADVDNYELDLEDIDAVDVEGNMVTLTLVDSVAQQAMGELTISNKILAVEAVEDFQFLDTTMPEALSAEVVGESTIKFTFSEPVQLPVKADFSIDEGNLFIDTIEMLNNNTEVNVTLYSTLEEGTLAVEVDDVEDFAGFSILAKTFQVEVVEDDEAPVVIGYKDATPLGVTLIFNEEVRWADGQADAAQDVTKFYHTNSNNDSDSVELEGNELEITFDEDYKMSPGSSYVYVMKEQVEDLWSNENAQVMIQVAVEIDETAPAVKSHDVTDEETIEIEFTEDVDSDTATDEDNYVVLEDGEEEDYIQSITMISDDTVEIKFNEKLAGDYVLVIENVEDLAGNEIAATSVAFEVEDMTAPLFTDFEAVGYDLSAEGQLIKINFGEAMAVEGAYAVNDVDKYIIDGTPLADLDGVTITVVDNGEAIEIKVPRTADLEDDETGMLIVDGDMIAIARVADAAGNYTAALSSTLTIDAATNINYTAELTGAKTVLLKFSDKLSNFEADDFVIFVEDGTTVGFQSAEDNELAVASRSVTVVDNKTRVKYTLVSELSTDIDVNEVRVAVDVVTPETENVYGQSVDPAANVAASDKAAPVLIDEDEIILAVSTTTDVILVEFSESLDTTVSPLLIASDFIITMDGDTLVAGMDYVITIINGTVADSVIRIDLDDEFDEEEVTVATRETVNYIKDTAGNKIEEIEEVTLEVE